MEPTTNRVTVVQRKDGVSIEVTASNPFEAKRLWDETLALFKNATGYAASSTPAEEEKK